MYGEMDEININSGKDDEWLGYENEIINGVKRFLMASKKNIKIFSRYSMPELYDTADITTIFNKFLENEKTIHLITYKDTENEILLENAIVNENMNLYGIKVASQFKDNLKIYWRNIEGNLDIIFRDSNDLMIMNNGESHGPKIDYARIFYGQKNLIGWFEERINRYPLVEVKFRELNY